MVSTEEALKRRLEQTRARLETLEARYSAAARKRDTRRKIIVGALLIDAAARDPNFKAILEGLLATLERPHDRRPFEGWSPPENGAAIQSVSEAIEDFHAPLSQSP